MERGSVLPLFHEVSLQLRVRRRVTEVFLPRLESPARHAECLCNSVAHSAFGVGRSAFSPRFADAEAAWWLEANLLHGKAAGHCRTP